MKLKIKNFLKTRFGKWLVLRLVSFYVSICYWTSKFECRGAEKLEGIDGEKPVILLFWHGRSLSLPLFNKKFLKSKSYGLFSDHSDGELIASLFRVKGVAPITASSFSSKGVSGLRKSLEVLKKNEIIGITPDGPTGPRYRITTDSAFFLSKKVGGMIFPITITYTNAKILEKTWDKFFLIRPFGKMVVELGDAVFVPRDASDKDIEKIKSKMESFMIKRTKELDMELIGRTIEPQDYENSRRVVKEAQRKAKLSSGKVK